MRASVDLETSGHQGLEDAVWVVLLRDRDQLLVVLRAIAGEDRLESSRVTHVVEGIIETGFLGGIVDRICGLFHPRSNNIVIGRANPLKDLGVAEIDLGGIQTQSISTTSLGCLHPVSTNGLPIQLNSRDVGSRDLLVQLGKLVEEGGVDDADTLVKLLIGSACDGSGNKNVAVAENVS